MKTENGIQTDDADKAKVYVFDAPQFMPAVTFSDH